MGVRGEHNTLSPPDGSFAGQFFTPILTRLSQPHQMFFIVEVVAHSREV